MDGYTKEYIRRKLAERKPWQVKLDSLTDRIINKMNKTALSKKEVGSIMMVGKVGSHKTTFVSDIIENQKSEAVSLGDKPKETKGKDSRT